MKRSVLALVCVALVAPAVSVAGPKTPANSPVVQPHPQAQANAEAGGSKPICRYVESTGSHLGGKKVCMSQADWNAVAFDSRRAIQKLQEIRR